MTDLEIITRQILEHVSDTRTSLDRVEARIVEHLDYADALDSLRDDLLLLELTSGEFAMQSYSPEEY